MVNASERLVVRATVECELMYYEVVGLNGSAQPTAGGALAPSTADPLGSCRTDFNICLLHIPFTRCTMHSRLRVHAQTGMLESGGAVMTNVAL